MFWGTSIKEGKPFKTNTVLEQNEFPVLHISTIAIPKSGPKGKYYLLASQGSEIKDLTVGVLEKDKNEVQALDLYINVSQQVTLTVQGPGELHLSGFFEPSREEMDEHMFDDEEDEEEEEEEEEEINGLNKSLKAAKLNAQKNATVARKQADSDEEEDDEDFEDEDEDEEEEESEEEQPVKKQQQQAAKPAQQQQQ